jgi:hypothetical protein
VKRPGNVARGADAGEQPGMPSVPITEKEADDVEEELSRRLEPMKCSIRCKHRC